MSDQEKRKRFIALSPFYKTKLTSVLDRTGRFLGIPEDKGIELCHLLGRECYTYLAIGDECNWELVRVEAEQGRLYLSGRGLEGTPKCEWQCNACVEYHPTASVLLDLKEQAGEKPEEEEPDEKNDQLYNGTLCIGIWDFHVKDGLIHKPTKSNRKLPQDDITRNPTLCWDKNGCITQAGGGAKPVAQLNCDK